jgi:hypothetical protein
MVARLACVLTALVGSCPGQTTLESCIASVGLPAADSRGWSAVVTVTVSPERDASRVTFDKAGRDNASYIVFVVLRTLRFRDACVGKRITIPITWQPTKHSGYGVALTAGTIVLSSYLLQDLSGAPRTHRPGRLGLGDKDFEELGRSRSIRDFVRSKGVDPDY